MPVPVVAATLALALSPMFAALARLIAGAGIALLTYQLVDTKVRPYFEDIFIALIGTSQEMGSVSGAGAQIYSYFEFTHALQIVVAAYVAAFSIRVSRLAFSAFSVTKA